MAQTIVDHLQASSAQIAVAQIRVLGGSMARVLAEATAFAHRGLPIRVNVAALYERPDEAAEHEPWLSNFAAALRQERVELLLSTRREAMAYIRRSRWLRSG